MGYAEKLLDPSQTLITDEFMCPICQELVKDPKACVQCNKTFCDDCIKLWQVKSEMCPFKCRKEAMQLVEMPDVIMMKYFSINLKCNKLCEIFVNILDYADHVANCPLPPCDNFQECHKKVRFYYNNSSICSYYCYRKIKESRNQPETGKVKSKNDWKNIDKYKRDFIFKWDLSKSSKDFKFKSYDKNHVVTVNGLQKYRNVISSVALIGGIYKIRFFITKNEHYFKLGFTSKLDFNVEEGSFCDYETGFGVSSIGQVRHGEKDRGLYYARDLEVKKDSMFDLELNMGIGEIKLWIDQKFIAIVFSSEQPESVLLTKGPWFPVVAVAGFVENIKILRIDN